MFSVLYRRDNNFVTAETFKLPKILLKLMLCPHNILHRKPQASIKESIGSIIIKLCDNIFHRRLIKP